MYIPRTSIFFLNFLSLLHNGHLKKYPELNAKFWIQLRWNQWLQHEAQIDEGEGLATISSLQIEHCVGVLFSKYFLFTVWFTRWSTQYDLKIMILMSIRFKTLV